MLRFYPHFSRRTGVVLAVMLAMAFGLSLGAIFFHNHTAYAAEQTAAVTTNSSARSALRGLQDAFTSIADEVLPSVVSITSKRTVEQAQGGQNDFFSPFGMPRNGAPQTHQEVGYGSGVIVRSNGYILTNDHVVGGADKVTVKLKDGREFEGTVSSDPKSDLAVVKINATNLPAAKLGASGSVKVGMWAIAMGSPFELDQTLTVGVISATRRQEVASDGEEARFYPNLLQTDASINPGNSGGPLVNIDGEIIGINALIRSGGNPMTGSGGNIGIGFAIPIDTAKFVLEQLITHGKVTRGYLGLAPADLTPKTADRYGVKEGALVNTVEVGTPADKAGFQVEDVIIGFDGKKIRNELDLRDAIAASAPGKKVDVVIVRDKKQQTIRVTIETAPDAITSNRESPKSSTENLGFSVTNITPELADKYKLGKDTKGVVVTNVSGDNPAAQEGIAPGLVITGVNGTPIKNVADFNAATKSLKAGDTVRLIIQTSQRRGLLEFTLE